MPLLRQSLLDTYLIRLRVIARFWEIPLRASRQREVALELAEAMTTPDAIQRAQSRLPEDQRQALEALLAAEGRMPRRIFARDWGEIRAIGPGRMEREQPWKEPVSPAEGLWYRGFLFQSFEQGPNGAYEAVYVPPELREHLPAPEHRQPTFALDPIPPPVATISGGDLLLDDACTLLAYVQNARPRLGPRGRLADRHKERLLRRFHVPDEERYLFLHHLASADGWVQGDDADRLRPVPETATGWLQDDSYPQRCAMVEAWLEDATWNDLRHVPGLRPEDTGAWQNDPVLARQTVLRHLEACAPQEWYDLGELVQGIKRVDPDFQRPSGDYTSWYIRDEQTGDYLTGFESWNAVEGRLIRYLLTRPLAWLGLVDLGAEEEGRSASSFRLTGDGAAFLGLSDPLPPPPPTPSQVRSGFRVAVPAARRYHRFQVARVAQWMQTGDPFLYRLTPSSLTRARRQGISVSRVIEFLEEICEAPLPQPFERALRRWEKHGAEAWLKQAFVLRLANEELMDQVTGSGHFAHLIEERIGPTAAVVREGDWPQVVVKLAEMGLLPETNERSE